jgi:hypothetical protein
MPRSADHFRSRAAAALVTVLAAAILTGCSDLYFDRRETISLGAGDGVAINRVTHMVDPWPPAAANRDIAFNGDKMQSAAARYRTGKIIQPKGLGTTSAWKQDASESGGATDSDIGTAKSAAGK